MAVVQALPQVQVQVYRLCAEEEEGANGQVIRNASVVGSRFARFQENPCGLRVMTDGFALAPAVHC